MMKLTEFYLERQGRPASEVTLDMESRAPSIPYGYLSGVMLSASYTTVEQTESYTAAGYTVILADGSITVTLPAASTNTGKYYYIKNIGTNTVTIEGDDSDETIDGEEFVTLDSQYQYVMVLCDGTVWHILGGEYVGLESTMDSMSASLEDKLDELIRQTKKNKFHLASLSGEEVDEDEED